MGPDDDARLRTTGHGPLASIGTIYETPDRRRCIVTFANRGTEALRPVRNERGDLWVGYLLPGDVEPSTFDDWERAWVPAELLRPVGAIDRSGRAEMPGMSSP